MARLLLPSPLFTNQMLFLPLSILGLLILLSSSWNGAALLLPHSSNSTSPLDDPEAVVLDLQRKLEAATTAAEASRRRSLAEVAAGGSFAGSKSTSSNCLTGNPIDDCWRCDPDWSRNRQRLADCGIGFGRDALGGKGGQIYTVTDSSDSDPVNPKPGTLRHAVIQDDPLWIVFSAPMTIRLNEELIMNSFKTIDGRGADVHITGGGCITLQYISNVIIHGVHIHNCVSAGNANVRSSPTHVGFRSKSDGDGISIFGSRKIWIDHCSLSSCADGLVDAIMGSTGLTISNSYFAKHNDVMLMGHSDDYAPDKGMQVTIAFNVFGPGLVQRMPRCRLGYFHVVNNDFTGWGMYAIGGSANPTINSQGNRYTAPNNLDAKEVTKRVDTSDGSWGSWDWRSEGDILVNGAVFVPSGEGLGGLRYEKASSIEPKSAGMVEQITMNAGVLGGGGRDNGGGGGGSSSSYFGSGGSQGTSLSGYLGMVYGGSAAPRSSMAFNALSYLCHCTCIALSLFLPALRLQLL